MCRLQVFSKQSLAQRLLTRSQELRLRLNHPETVSGAASKSLLPRARREISGNHQRRNFQAEGVTRQDNEIYRSQIISKLTRNFQVLKKKKFLL